MPEKPYRAAVIGLGRMGSTFDDEITRGGQFFMPYCHAPTYVASPYTNLVAGADPHAEQGEIFADRWGLESGQIYADYREMLEAVQPEFVSLCTTARHRAAIMIDAINAGVKAIWAEKPFTLSLAEADEVNELGKRKGVAIAVNCSRRYNVFFNQARRMVDEGELGEILQITAYAQCNLSHNGSHAIDAMRYLVDADVQWVFGEMESDEKAAGVEDLMGNGYLAFDNGARGFIRGTPTGAAPWEFDLIGTEGRVRNLAQGMETQYYRWVPGGLRDQGLPARAPFPLPTHIPSSGLSVIEDLVDCIETGRQPRCSGQDGRKALEIAIAMRESHRLGGRRVDLPLADRSLHILSSEILSDAVPARVRRMQRQ
ncbi:MAG: Gfo/Idh/MocA family oxidoreductase [Caldilineaceae bacterium]|nr:Gfo/Idh/MocA family oxidoreductase [Caldilineaceae bacterium]